MISLVAFAFAGCGSPTTTEPSTGAMTTASGVDVVAIVEESVDELEEIVAERRPDDLAASLPPVAEPAGRTLRKTSELTTYTPEDFHAVYDVQVSNHLTVDIAGEYEAYATLIDAILAELLIRGEVGDVTTFTIGSELDERILDVTVASVEDRVLIVATETYDAEETPYTVSECFLLGFADEIFLFDHLVTGTWHPGEYSYSGYIEDDRFLLVNTGDDGFDFKMISDTDDTMEEYSTSAEGGGSHLAWYDPATSRRTHLFRAIDETTGDPVVYDEFYELFNEHGIYLMYKIPGYEGADRVQVWWSLLDATGWDAVVVDPETYGGSDEVELYRGSERLFADERFLVRGYLDVFTCLYLVLEESADYFTADVLDLSAYGLLFDYEEITPAWIEEMRETDKAAADAWARYGAIDLLAEDAEAQFHDVLPDVLTGLVDSGGIYPIG